MLHETLSDALDVAEKELAGQKIVLVDSFRDHFQYGGIPYGQKRESHTAIETIKGKKTRKYFHVIVTRMETGRYEVICYAS